MQTVDRVLVFVLAFLSMVAVAPLWEDTSGGPAGATVLAIVQATPQTATNPINANHTITATATDTFSGSPLVGYDIAFNVLTGPNTGVTGAGTTDANGQATFTYTGAGGPGDDSIEVCVSFAGGPSLDCDTVAKTWIVPTPTASPTPLPTATSAATSTPTAVPSPTLTPVQLPNTGAGNNGSSLPWVILGASVFVALLLVAGATALRRIR